MNADSFKDMQVQTRGEFGGLGIEVTMENGLVKVVSPIDGTPAFRAGVQSGDLISHLDGEAVMGLNLNEAVDRMRGKVGTDLIVTIIREGTDPFDVTLTRAIIKIQSVRFHMEDDIGYIRITSFSQQTDSGVRRALKDFQAEKGDDLAGIILDLRNNPGGLLDQAIAVSDVFLSKGEIVSTRGKNPNDTQRYSAHTNDATNGLPVIVLINGGSASASEIVAGALQDHGRAVVLGTQSFGKGSVQTIIPLGSHGAMRLTTSLYFTPSGRSIQAMGVEPDILVEQAKLENIGPGFSRREADLRGALSNGNNGETQDDNNDQKADDDQKTGDSSADDDTPLDYQLQRAIDLIHGVSLFSFMMEHNNK
jgi:carboxyl-terminal processing protease